MGPTRRPPPRSLAELVVRAEALAGHTIGELAAALGVSLAGSAVRTKGHVGQLLERALGAAGGSAPEPDFRELGVELKSVPVDEKGAPRESTFVCAINLAEADLMSWEGSLVRAKLAHVLFVPVFADGGEVAERRIGVPCFYRPTPEQEAILRADFEDLAGVIGMGGTDELTAHQGRWLQVRPKAANGAVRTFAPGGDGGVVETGPKGFYLRRHFVAGVLVDRAGIP